MKIAKSWLFIVLFAFSLNIIGEFSPNLHQDIIELTHEHEANSFKYDVLCDACHCSHIKSMLDTIDSKISYKRTAKPKFEIQGSLLASNKPQLLKPPIT